jgi:uncharacterized protein YbaA (DUF1428 family)
MKSLLIGLLALVLGLFSASAEGTRVFELRTYQAHPGKLDDLHARFRDHTLALFAKHGMTNVGYWVPKENEGNTLVYLMAYPSRDDREKMWKSFVADPEWKAVYAKSHENGKLVAKVESVFLKPTDYAPELKIEAKNPARLFELRKYTTNEGKLPALHARFCGHTVKLFQKHGMTNVIYFDLMDDQKGAGNTLIYLLAHPDEAARNASFDTFRTDPEWQAAQKASEENGKLLVKGGAESTLLIPTDYSPMK